MRWLKTGIDVSVSACTGTFVQAKAPEVGRDKSSVTLVPVIIPAEAQGYRCAALTVARATPAIDGMDKASAGVMENLTLADSWTSRRNGGQRVVSLVDGVVAPPAPGSGLTGHAVTAVIPRLPDLPRAPSGHAAEAAGVDESGRSDPQSPAHHKGVPRMAGCSER